MLFELWSILVSRFWHSVNKAWINNLKSALDIPEFYLILLYELKYAEQLRWPSMRNKHCRYFSRCDCKFFPSSIFKHLKKFSTMIETLRNIIFTFLFWFMFLMVQNSIYSCICHAGGRASVVYIVVMGDWP